MAQVASEQAAAKQAAAAFPMRALLAWFKREQRGLPWRSLVGKQLMGGQGAQAAETRDPYAVWILETMLQQTQLQTVLPYYKRWMERYPDVQTLAQTTRAEALRYFQGLGYYRRLYMLLKGARVLTERYNGVFPQTRSELLSIPGIGHYTAGALLSFAFHKRAAVVDGNIVRVLSRYDALTADKTTLARLPSAVWQRMEDLLPREGRRAARFNEAMMELGSIVCRPRHPHCLSDVSAPLLQQRKAKHYPPCPLMAGCQAYQQGEVLRYPLSVRVKTERVFSSLFVIQTRGRVLLLQRTADNNNRGRFSGLWRFPIVEHHIAHTELTEQTRVQLCKKHCQLSLRRSSLRLLETYKAAYTRYRAEVCVYAATLTATAKLGKDHRWFMRAELSLLGLASLDGRVRTQVLEDKIHQ